MRLNKKVEYALISLNLMNKKRPGELTTPREIHQLIGSPLDATSKVLQAMNRKQILQSVQGANGGYFLQRDLATVSLFELILTIVGKEAVVSCLRAEPNCDIDDRCNIIPSMTELNRRIDDFYKSINVLELLGEGNSSSRCGREHLNPQSQVKKGDSVGGQRVDEIRSI